MPRLLISDTAVPDAFIMQYVQELSKDAVGIYLWILMRGLNDGFNLDDVYEFSTLSKEACNNAVAELMAHSLVYKKNEDNRDIYLITDLKQLEVDNYVKSCVARGVTSDGLELSADEKLRNQLTESISNTCYLGKMPYIYYRLIDKCLYEYKFEDLVILRLFEEGKKKKCQLNSDKMNKMATEWYNRGYVTTEKLSIYVEKEEQIEAIKNKMHTLLGYWPNGLDMEKIERWVNDLGVSEALAEYAFRCNDFRGKVTLRHVEDTLVTWIGAGITSIDAAMVFENEKHNENKRKASRKKNKGNSWMTGAEAGLLDDKEEIKPEVKPEPEKNKMSDVLLDLFGDDDEDN